MRIYNKLVRDKIPEIIKNDNCGCKFRILDDKEYKNALNVKIQEELKEFLVSGELEELADVEEVIRAIVNSKNISYEQFDKIREEKNKKRGNFSKKIYLESVDK